MYIKPTSAACNFTEKLPSKRRMASLEAPVRRTYFASETAGASIRCPPVLLEGHAN